MKAGLVYAQKLGWRVVPLHSAIDGVCSCSKGRVCTSAGKHPRVTDWVNEATNDPEVIQEWIDQWPDANVGIATGYDWFVLDEDPDKGGDVALAKLTAEHEPLPETPQAQTGSGGHHYLFRVPAGTTITNSKGRLPPGLDIRGQGGQIVVYPSVSAKGPYTWILAPWDVEIADAPDWLLELILSPAMSRSSGAQIPDSRPAFSAASPAVLVQARDTLELHGPAIDGDNGGLHTVQAAAILTHDFALTQEEAWPLFVEWNETCVPPWELEDAAGQPGLRTMLGRGLKYGKAEYGCRRKLDPLEIAKKLFNSWNSTDDHLVEISNQLREVEFRDPTTRGIVERYWCEKTGMSKKELGLPQVRAEFSKAEQGQILVTVKLNEVADQSVKAIADLVFQRNGKLCEVANAGQMMIADLETPRIQDLMSQASEYVRQDDEGLVTMIAPERVASILGSRTGHEGVRVLEAVTAAPIFLGDGSILQERGYNAQARVYLEPNVSVDVPEAPDRDVARRALGKFWDLLCDYHFASKADFSAWVAALLSPLVKAATGNAPSPLICISASSAGAGKTLLTTIISQIISGNRVEVRTYSPKDPGEWGKRLTAFVKAASPISVFDNATTSFGDEGIDRLVTSSTWSDRLLGASDAPALPNVTTWFITGNNIEPVGDTVRRVLMVRIEVDTERPQERTGFKHNIEGDVVLERRSELLSAALTVLRAYHVAGRPPQDLPSWGSFTTWSALIRGALVWAGLPDPYLTQQRLSELQNEPENDAHDFWLGVVAKTDGTPAGIVQQANQEDAQGVLGAREPLTVIHLRRFIARFVDKPRQGRRIRKRMDRASKQVTYRVETI